MTTSEGAATAFAARLARIAALDDAGATTLPGAFYTCEAWFASEREKLLETSWHCLGRVDEIAGPNSYRAASVLGEPLLVTSDEGGRVRVLSNVCRHRAMPLTDGAGRGRLLVCPYHGWSYRLDGRLARAPGMENTGFEASRCRLPEVRSTVWQGFLYVDLSGRSMPLEADISGLDRLLARYETPAMRFVHAEEEVWRTNWKCLVENFMEGYHLSVVHPKTLDGYTPTRLARKTANGPGFTSYAANYPDGIPSRGLGAPGLTPEERQRSTLFCVFPTQVASQAASLLVSLCLDPVAVDETRVRWTLSTYGDDLGEDVLEERIALWREVNREDREKLERLQVALGARAARDHAGPLAGADLEGTIRDFHKHLASRLAAC